MAEDTSSVDIATSADLARTDSNRRYVSTNLPTGAQSSLTTPELSAINSLSSSEQLNVLAKAVNIDLSSHLSKLTCHNAKNVPLVNPARVTVVAQIHNELDTVGQLDSPDALRLTSCRSFDITTRVTGEKQNTLTRPEKRKRNSPQTRNVREKLLQYAYKDRSNKNVTFSLQADEDAISEIDIDDNTAMEEERSEGSSASSTSVTVMAAPSSSHTNAIRDALPQRQGRQSSRPLHITAVQTLPTEEEMRKYIVPDRQVKFWKLYEHQLRLVGRAQARINQLDRDIEARNPPSWCFGGTQAPQYMRPYHKEFVKLTKKYAMQMAILAKNILSDQAQSDAGEARHLQETLYRMYREANDPNFELATGRAEGIAAYYTRKEHTLNIRLAEEDQQFVPQTEDEWADQLARRKITKPSARRSSRSRSRDNKHAPKTQGKQNPPKSNNKKNEKTSQGPQPTKKRHIAPKSGQSNPGYQPNTFPQYPPVPRINSNHQLNSARPSSSNQAFNMQPTRTASTSQSGQPRGATSNTTILSTEEQRLITMLRASKNNDK